MADRVGLARYPSPSHHNREVEPILPVRQLQGRDRMLPILGSAKILSQGLVVDDDLTITRIDSDTGYRPLTSTHRFIVPDIIRHRFYLYNPSCLGCCAW
jgi:hypothetical protein